MNNLNNNCEVVSRVLLIIAIFFSFYNYAFTQKLPMLEGEGTIVHAQPSDTVVRLINGSITQNRLFLLESFNDENQKKILSVYKLEEDSFFVKKIDLSQIRNTSFYHISLYGDTLFFHQETIFMKSFYIDLSSADLLLQKMKFKDRIVYLKGKKDELQFENCIGYAGYDEGTILQLKNFSVTLQNNGDIYYRSRCN